MFFTGNRAEFGLLKPVIKCFAADKNLEVILIVSGSHFSAKFGKTVGEIEIPGLKQTVHLDLGEEADDVPFVVFTVGVVGDAAPGECPPG